MHWAPSTGRAARVSAQGAPARPAAISRLRPACGGGAESVGGVADMLGALAESEKAPTMAGERVSAKQQCHAWGEGGVVLSRWRARAIACRTWPGAVPPM